MQGGSIRGHLAPCGALRKRCPARFFRDSPDCDFSASLVDICMRALLLGLLIAATTTFGQTVIVQPKPEETTVETFVHNLDSGVYKLVSKHGNKEYYVDTRTGEKWKVEIHYLGHVHQ